MNINHVGNKGEALELQLGDICLQQNIDLGGRFLHAFLDWDRDAFQQFAQLQLLLLADGEKFELLRKGKDAEQLDGGHSGSEVLVVCGHGIVGHVEVGGDAPEVGTLELSRGSLVLDKMTLLKESGGSVDNVSALLDEGAVVVLVIHTDAIEGRVLEHAHIPGKQ